MGRREAVTGHPALAIGAIAGGPGTSRAWSDAVKALGRRVIDLREGLDSPLAVNVVFQIPGQFLEPDFEGVRTGQFSRKERRLLVQVALPSRPAGDAVEEVRRFLTWAIYAAEEFAQMEGLVAGELSSLRELVDRL